MQESLKIFGTFIAGSAVGLLVGYKVAEKRLGDIFEERLETETADMRVFYSETKPESKKYSTPEEAVAALIPEPDNPVDPREKSQKVSYHKIVKAEQYAISDEVEGAKATEEEGCEIEGLTHHNVFKSARDTEKPYVVSQDEFMQNDPNFEQVTLTWYSCGTLTDVREDKIDDRNLTVGEDFASFFGVGSSDENVVHIRNEKLGIDFEVVRSQRSYDEDVLGESGS